MTTATVNDVRAELLRIIRGFFDSRRIALTADGLREWCECLADLPPQQVAIGFRRFNKEATDYPTPAAIRRYAGVVGMSDQDRAAVAWAAVHKAVREWGHFQSVNFDDPLINAAIRMMGGWISLCDTLTAESLPFREQDFRRHYSTISRSGVGNASPLPGLAQQEQALLPVPIQQVQTGLPLHPISARLEVMPQRRLANAAVLRLVEATNSGASAGGER